METRDRWGTTGTLRFEVASIADLLDLKKTLLRRQRKAEDMRRYRAMDKALGRFKDGRAIRPVAA